MINVCLRGSEEHVVCFWVEDIIYGSNDSTFVESFEMEVAKEFNVSQLVT